jgi:outer membrane protein assembly factor BamA
MLSNKPQSSPVILIALSVLLLIVAACGVAPKGYPVNKPFVWDTKIHIEGNLSKTEKDILESQLRSQLDDSMKVKTTYKFISFRKGYGGINRPIKENPPAFDSASAERSMIFMKALLNKLGFLRNTISYDSDTTIVKDEDLPTQYRTTVNFFVKTNQLFRLDSISHVINNNELQALTEASKKNTFLKKGDPFAQPLVSEELNRLVQLYKENGYLKFSFEELSGVWDTLNLAILRPNVDPFDVQFLEELRRRRDSPTVDLEIRFRPGYDVGKVKKYFIGNTTIFPDYSVIDTSGIVPTIFIYDSSFTFISYRNIFKRKFIAQNIYFQKGDLYNEKKFLKTINRFNELGAWRVVNYEQLPRALSDTVDLTLYLTPALKHTITANIEGSFNNSNSIVLQENLLGVGANAQWTNFNFGRSSNKSTLTGRFSTELDTKGQFVKTRQGSLTYGLQFPKPIPNVKWLPEKFKENFRTNFIFSVANTDRNDWYNLTSLNASWTYSTRWNNKSAFVKFPNVEYAHVLKRDSLIKFLDSNQTLKNVFPENGLVFSIQGGFTVRWGKGKSSQILRTNAEISGVPKFLDLKIFDSLFKFIKFDAEYINNFTLGKNNLILRGYIGAGFAMKTKRPNAPQLPFFKQFTAGGPYSMRAWGVRLLGPGSSLKTRAAAPIRFGDFQLEGNIEYRFPLTKLFGYKVASCFFADFGNVWFVKENPDFPNGNLTADFYKDIAIGIGTGLRMDFEFLKVRFDYGLKVKNPTPEPVNAQFQNKLFADFKPLGGIVQIGINYPFAF